MDADVPLFALEADAHHVRASGVQRLPFGRVRRDGRELQQSVSAWPGFVAAPLDAQWRGAAIGLEESRAAEAMVETLANAVSQLVFGLRGEKIALALAIGDRVSARGTDVEVLEDGPRILDLPSRLTKALRARDVRLAGDLAGPIALDRARVRGEQFSPTGALVGVESALLVHWDETARLVAVEGGAVQSVHRLAGLGLGDVERAYDQGGGARRLGVAARRDDPKAAQHLTRTVNALAASVTAHLAAASSLPERVVLCGRGALLLGDARLAPSLLPPFELAVAAVASHERARGGAGSDEAPVLRTSWLVEAALLGAAATALGLGRSEPGARTGSSPTGGDAESPE